MSDRCQGITSTGQQCRRTGSPYCAQHKDNPCTADFSAMIERACNGIAVALAAWDGGRWNPSGKSLVLLDELRLMLEARRG